ncbi:MAG: secondary thiamine-phosphate synthase enzyme YjbQ [Chthoniobacterales bacterium]
MTAHHHSFSVKTRGKGTYEITHEIEEAVAASSIKTGLATIFLRHTSASLIIYENADSTARTDLHNYFDDLVPEEGDYAHTLEGPDDTTSHLKMALTRSSESIPIARSRLTLGTWQGIFLFEHRRAPHTRHLDISIIGE